ncbi:MAG: hypothetical protein PHT91_00935 [Candidatus Nanoarchaeia archaeon]|nr:hypothetical protein [Candidatus Nanoarchaeia archaeon]MDD5499424.1 hypothetical protein [Candidatus Nanoarchaeia archaeon]
MNIKLIGKKEDKLAGKTVYELELKYDGLSTPSRKQALELASKEIGVKKELMVIKKIKNFYGKSFSLLTIHAYPKRDDLEKNEPKHLIKRISGKEDEAAGASSILEAKTEQEPAKEIKANEEEKK